VGKHQKCIPVRASNKVKESVGEHFGARRNLLTHLLYFSVSLESLTRLKEEVFLPAFYA
jgi:hypothetical protein